MARDIRNFMAVVLTAAVVGLGIALIGVTQDAPGEGMPGRWHIVDEAQADFTTVLTVQEYPGSNHCDWERADMLYMEGSGYTDIWGTYIRDPDGVLSEGATLAPYLDLVELPDNAEFTGWSNGNRMLWLSPDGSYVYLARGSVAQGWPRANPELGCL